MLGSRRNWKVGQGINVVNDYKAGERKEEGRKGAGDLEYREPPSSLFSPRVHYQVAAHPGSPPSCLPTLLRTLHQVKGTHVHSRPVLLMGLKQGSICHSFLYRPRCHSSQYWGEEKEGVSLQRTTWGFGHVSAININRRCLGKNA